MTAREARRAKAPAAGPQAPKRATRDPEGTRKAILEAAIAEFAREGYGGGRVDRISRAARSNDRMVYYYFGSKEALFREAIESVYAALVAAEQALALDLADPVAALEALVEFNWRYYVAHPELISILNTENLYRAEHIRRSEKVSSYASPQIAIIGRVLDEGDRSGAFRAGIDPQETFLTIASLTYFYLSNIHTLSNYLGRDLGREEALERWLVHVKGVVLASLRPTS